jgi:hypothetical protein
MVMAGVRALKVEPRAATLALSFGHNHHSRHHDWDIVLFVVFVFVRIDFFESG